MISSLYNASRSAGIHFIHRVNYNYNNSIKFYYDKFYGTIQNVNDEYSTKEYKLCLHRNLPTKEFNKKGGDTM